MMHIFNKMALWQKLALLGLFSILLMAGPLYLYLKEVNADVQFAERELAGVAPVAMVLSKVKAIQKHRGLGAGVLDGQEQMRAPWLEARAEIESSFQDIGTLLSERGASPQLLAQWSSLQKQWQEAVTQATGSAARSDDLFTSHNLLIKNMFEFATLAADDFRLSYDPKPDGYHLIIASTQYLPIIAEDLAKMRGLGVKVLSRKAMWADDSIAFATVIDAVEEHLANAKRELRKAFAASAEVEQALAAELDSASKATIESMYYIEENILSAPDLTDPPEPLFNAMTVGVEAQFKLMEAALNTLEVQLQARVDALNSDRASLLAVMGVLLAVITLIGALIARAIALPMRRAVNVADAIAQGALDNDCITAGTDESAQLLNALSQMQDSLLERQEKDRERQEQDRRVAAEMKRIKQGLDVASTNVMVADDTHRVIYLNESIQEMFKTAEDDIRKVVASFNVDEVEGSEVDTLLNREGDGNSLDALEDTASERIEMGGRSFDLTLTPILDDQNCRLGTVIEWQDMTDELAAEAREEQRLAEERRIADENARIKIALDNVTANVMIANNNREIIYFNEALTEMLGKAEADIQKDLPNFDSSNLLGQQIDIFHKNPEHQKRLLAALEDTFKTEIKVGGRTLRIIASPVVNDDGERLGTVVEWKDRTAELAVEDEMANIVGAAANGDFSQRASIEGKDGFFLQLANNMNQLMETSSVGLSEVVRVLSALAKGDLTQTITNDYQGTFGQLKDDANLTVQQLTKIVGQIKEATDSINTAAGEIASGNSDLSQRTEQQAASLEETASSMEELTSTVKQNAENAQQANQLVIGASEVATKGGRVVGEVVTTMSSITDASKKIEDIISVIDGIAFQTNILALNAAVEAARAGEQGRGFAVVASEVRSLAQRSANAAKEIKELISDSVGKIENGSALVEQAGQTMEEIVNSVKRVTDIMGEITAASQEQSSGIEQVNQTITQMDEVTQQNAALVEQANASAKSLEEQAGGLAASVSAFKLSEDDEDHSNVRVAPQLLAQAAKAKSNSEAQRVQLEASPARANGKTNGRSNGKSNGHANGHSNGRGHHDDDQWTEF